MLRWSDSLGLIISIIPICKQSLCQTVLSAKGLSRRTVGIICKKSIVPQDYPLCKRPAQDQLSNQLHGICIQPVEDPLHSYCLISHVELAHPPRGRSVPIERTEVQSHAVYWQESPITGTQPPFSTTQKRYKKYKNTNLQKYTYKKRTIQLLTTHQLFCIFWNL